MSICLIVSFSGPSGQCSVQFPRVWKSQLDLMAFFSQFVLFCNVFVCFGLKIGRNHFIQGLNWHRWFLCSCTNRLFSLLFFLHIFVFHLRHSWLNCPGWARISWISFFVIEFDLVELLFESKSDKTASSASSHHHVLSYLK